MRETGQAVGCLSYQHLQRPRDLDDEAWIYTLGRVGSLRYRALKKSSWVEDCLNNTAGPSLKLAHKIAFAFPIHVPIEDPEFRSQDPQQQLCGPSKDTKVNER